MSWLLEIAPQWTLRYVCLLNSGFLGIYAQEWDCCVILFFVSSCSSSFPATNKNWFYFHLPFELSDTNTHFCFIFSFLSIYWAFSMCRHCASGWSWACPWVSDSLSPGKDGIWRKESCGLCRVTWCGFHTDRSGSLGSNRWALVERIRNSPSAT